MTQPWIAIDRRRFATLLLIAASSLLFSAADAKSANTGDALSATQRAATTAAEQDLIPACSRDQLMITGMKVGKHHVRISGVARRSHARRYVRIYFKPTGRRVVARAPVNKDGRFHTRVKRPARAVLHRGSTRYRAELAGDRTPWLKLSRSLRLSHMRAAAGRLYLDGRVAGAKRGTSLIITKSVNCGPFRRIGSTPVRPTRLFDSSISVRKHPKVVLIRLRATIRSRDGSGTGTTYSLTQPMLIGG